MNITPTITLLELGWVLFSLYTLKDAVNWIHDRRESKRQLTDRHGPAIKAVNFLLSIGWYGFTVAVCNVVAGVGAMFVGPAPQLEPPSIFVVIISLITSTALICALIALKVLMIIIEAYRKSIVEYYIQHPVETTEYIAERMKGFGTQAEMEGET